MGFCMALSMNSVGIPGGFRGGNAGFRENLGFGVVSGDLGGQKASAQIASANFALVAEMGLAKALWRRRTASDCD